MLGNNFYYLGETNAFSFATARATNLLKNASNIQCKIEITNEAQRNIDFELIRLHPFEKFSVKLSGCGKLTNVPNYVFFVSSQLVLPFDSFGNRRALFDYFFNANQMPLEDKVSNVAVVQALDPAEQREMFGMPMLQCLVKNIVQGENWQLMLEEC